MRHPDLIRCKINVWQILHNRRRILIIEDLKVGYIPIYKVASTSLRNLFCHRQAEFCLPRTDSREMSVSEKRQMERHLRCSRGVWRTRRLKETYFLFAFVRNPITRLYSCYLDKIVRIAREGRRRSLHHYGFESYMEFDDFARRVAAIPDSKADRHFRSQHFQIYHKGDWLVDFLGKFENMNEDWQRLTEKIGIDESPGMHRSTGAGGELDKLPLSLETARIIVQRYSVDIDILGYRDEINAWLSRKSEHQSGPAPPEINPEVRPTPGSPDAVAR